MEDRDKLIHFRVSEKVFLRFRLEGVYKEYHLRGNINIWIITKNFHSKEFLKLFLNGFEIETRYCST